MNSANSKVLVVDDDPAMVRLLARWLEDAGYQVQQASNGSEALAIIERDCPHHILTDWEMPELDGVALCQRVRSMSWPHYIYLIIESHRSDASDIVTGLEAGADDFVTKPIQRGVLLARMRAGERVLELENRLRGLAHTDALTGLPSKRALSERFAAEWSRAIRYRLPLSCVMVDIDFFKHVNDRVGHAAGDAVLRAVAQRLVASSRTSDFVCRYAGDEFCIILPETTEFNAALWAERARASLAATPVQAGGQTVSINCTFGVAQRWEDLLEADELIDLADQALLVAKQSGRNRVVAFSGTQAEENLDELLGSAASGPFSRALAKHVMTAVVSCLPEETSLLDAAGFFLQHRLSSTPVVDREGRLRGILSEKDLMGVMLWPENWQQPVSTVMKRNVVCYEEDTLSTTIYDFLCRVTIRQVVIVKEGVPTGMIGRGNLLHWFNSWIQLRNAPSVSPSAECDDPRRALLDMAAATVRQSTLLQADLERGDDLEPAVISHSTKIQELTTDMMANLRSAIDLRQADYAQQQADNAGPQNDEPTGIAWFPLGCEPNVR